MTAVWSCVETEIAAHGRAALVTLVATRGSAPREAGAAMVVRPDGAFHGTIGGGALEWMALGRAQALLAGGRREAEVIRQALGPDLGQCCGGHVLIVIEAFAAADRGEVARLAALERAGRGWLLAERGADGRYRRRPVEAGEGALAASAERFAVPVGDRTGTVLIFGAGHVGRALVLALAPLPFRVLWHDGRGHAFPAAVPANASCRSGDWRAVLAEAPADAQVLVMTHSHALDLAIVAAALSRDPPGPVGVIGSATKRARFARQLAALGVSGERTDALRCPIGIAGIRGKEPAVIAAAVAAECLLLREAAGGQVLIHPARRSA